MNKAIANMIKEYQEKIDDEDKLIETYKVLIIKKRHSGDDGSFERLRMSFSDSRRMTLIQARIDFESLLDNC